MTKSDFKNAHDFVDFTPAKDGDLDAVAAAFEAELKADKDVYGRIQQLGLSRKEVSDNLGMLMDFKEDFSICKNCPGLSKCPKENVGYSLEIHKENGYLERRYAPCHKVVLHMQRDSKYIMSDFPDEWKDKTMDDIDRSAARDKVLAKLLTAREKEKWCYLTGDFNGGKSYILACFANDFAAKHGEMVAFADTPKLIDRLRESSIKNKEAFEKEMKALVEVPLLILDGFGDEYKSDFAFSAVLYPILRERARTKKFTIFASDFSYDDLAAMYGPKVGTPRAKQLMNLISSKCGKPAVLEGLNVY